MELFDLINNCVSPYHTVRYVGEKLKTCGFEELPLSGKWNLKKGGKYFVNCFESGAVAFTVGKSVKAGDAFRLVASHIDTPCFRVKPSPEQVCGGCLKLSVDAYGGMIDSTWLDRPLSLAGIVTVKTDSAFAPETKLVDFDEPALVIPNLAIHLNRDANKGVAHNYAKTMLPVCKTVEEGFSKNGYLLSVLADKLGIDKDAVLSFDLVVYCAEKPCKIGFEGDFISSPRLDNMTSVLTCLKAISEAECASGINAALFYDNEEVGSASKQGADSNIVSVVLEKAAQAVGIGRADYLDMLTSGALLSCDVAHAIHPNYSEMYDPSNFAQMNKGLAIKMNFKQGYPTDVVAIAAVEALCKNGGIPYQRFMSRADVRGGGTIGAFASSILTMRTVDVGVPILAMHSAVETMGARDQEALDRLAKAFLEN